MLAALRAYGYLVSDEDAVRSSSLVRAHVVIYGHCRFHLTELGRTQCPLCDPDVPHQD